MICEVLFYPCVHTIGQLYSYAIAVLENRYPNVCMVFISVSVFN